MSELIIFADIIFSSPTPYFTKELSKSTLLKPKEYRIFVSLIDSQTIPKSVSDAMSNIDWQASMEDDFHTLEQNKTWKIVSLLAGEKIIGNLWVYNYQNEPCMNVSTF